MTLNSQCKVCNGTRKCLWSDLVERDCYECRDADLYGEEFFRNEYERLLRINANLASQVRVLTFELEKRDLVLEQIQESIEMVTRLSVD
jgi:hypothetical protein